jgi:hypothetical protein
MVEYAADNRLSAHLNGLKGNIDDGLRLNSLTRLIVRAGLMRR